MAEVTKAREARQYVLTTKNNSIFKGSEYFLDRIAGKIILKNVTSDGVQLFGLQHFYSSDLVDMQQIGDGQDDSENQKQLRFKKKNFNFEKVPLAHLSYLKDLDTDELTMSNIFQDANNDSDKEGFEEDCKDVEDYRQTEEYILLNRICDQFYDAMKHIMEQSIVAVNFDGVHLGRNGTLSLIEVATETKLFVFDMLKMGVNAFNEGLDALFASKAILKVMHDCRFVSDMMHHKYKISMVNIFDTQVANAFVYRLIHHGEWPRHVESLPGCLVNHLNLSNDQVHFMRVSGNFRKKDEAVWLQRPLADKLLSAACMNIKYLIQLHHVLMKKMLLEFKTGVYIYLNHVDNNGGEVEKCRANLHLLPHAFQNIQHYTSYYNLIESGDKREVQYDKIGFRENCPNIKDKEITFSHDSIWHRSYKSGERKTDNKGKVPKERSTKLKNNPHPREEKTTIGPEIKESPNQNLMIPEERDDKISFNLVSKNSVEVDSTNSVPDAASPINVSDIQLKTRPTGSPRKGQKSLECPSSSSPSSSEFRSTDMTRPNSKDYVKSSPEVENIKLSPMGSQQLDSSDHQSTSQSAMETSRSSSRPENNVKSKDCDIAVESIRKSKLWKVSAKSVKKDETSQPVKSPSILHQMCSLKDQNHQASLNSPPNQQTCIKREQHSALVTSPPWPLERLSPKVQCAGGGSDSNSDGDVGSPSRYKSVCSNYSPTTTRDRSRLAGNSLTSRLHVESTEKKAPGDAFLNRPPSLLQNLTSPPECSEAPLKSQETISMSSFIPAGITVGQLAKKCRKMQMEKKKIDIEGESSKPLENEHAANDDFGDIPMQHSLNRKSTMPLGVSALGIGNLFSEEENCQSSDSREEFVKSRLTFKDEVAIKDRDIELLHQTEAVQKILKLASLTSNSDVKKKLLPSLKPPPAEVSSGVALQGGTVGDLSQGVRPAEDSCFGL
ncbi:unnamed protein product [Lymnaea stagnalis]|uniref:3'-5' exonuclease domain-containing protein n=1 Tax=Lymnaea stagnalis TaxID=6523 RepID=A0AAV2H8Y5_LYMST